MKFLRVTGTIALFLSLGTLIPVYAQHEGKQEEKEAKPGAPQSRQAPPQQRQEPAQQHAQQAQPQQRHEPAQQHAQQAQPQQRQEPAQQHAQQAQPQQRHEPAQQHAQQAQPQQRQEPAQQHAQQAQPQQRQQATQQRVQQAQPRQQPQRAPEQAKAWQAQRGWAQKGAWGGHATFQQDRARNWASDHRTWAQRGGYGGYYIPQATFGLYFGSQHFFRLGALSMYLGYPRFSYGGISFLLVDPWPEYWSDNWYSADDLYIDYDYNDDGYYLYNHRYPDVRLAVTVVM